MNLQRGRESLKRPSLINKDGELGIMDNIKKGGIWGNPIAKHLLAWMVLMAIGIAAWKMAVPVRISMQETGKTTTSLTITRNGNEQAKEESGRITTATSLQGVDQQQKSNKVEVIIEALNIRAEPSPKGLKIGKLRKGTVVQVLETNGKWLKIKTGDNKVGYISSDKRLIKVIP